MSVAVYAPLPQTLSLAEMIHDDEYGTIGTPRQSRFTVSYGGVRTRFRHPTGTLDEQVAATSRPLSSSFTQFSAAAALSGDSPSIDEQRRLVDNEQLAAALARAEAFESSLMPRLPGDGLATIMMLVEEAANRDIARPSPAFSRDPQLREREKKVKYDRWGKVLKEIRRVWDNHEYRAKRQQQQQQRQQTGGGGNPLSVTASAAAADLISCALGDIVPVVVGMRVWGKSPLRRFDRDSAEDNARMRRAEQLRTLKQSAHMWPGVGGPFASPAPSPSNSSCSSARSPERFRDPHCFGSPLSTPRGSGECIDRF